MAKVAKSRETGTFGSPRQLALGLGSLAGMAVLLTLADPGITTDEPLDVRPGRTYVETLRTRGLGFLERSTVDRVFGDNAEHPPLGRWLLGIASTLGQGAEILLRGPDPLGLYVVSGRLAPAACFAILVGLIVHASARRYGNVAGVAAGLALLSMPRVFAHAHLGALDTFITLFWVAALLAAEHALGAAGPIRRMALAGVALGLALLTKIHAWLLIPLILVWACVRVGPRRGVVGWLCWLAVGLLVFLAGWPWLWHDTLPRLARYLGTGVQRTPIRVLYLGQVYLDRDVPWHYPWVYFLVTVPVGIHVLGVLGLARSWRDRQVDPLSGLVLAAIGMLLSLFSTRVPVYDGERLFLMTFPLWAILSGRGFGAVWEKAKRRAARALLVVFLAAQVYGLVAYHPFQLSYHNAIVGGLAGAERIGFESTFWGDAVDRVLLDQLAREAPEGAKVALVPTLYPGQGMATVTGPLARKSLIPGDDTQARDATWLIVSRRVAYWPDWLPARLASGRLVAQRSRAGVWLSALYRFDAESTVPSREQPLPPIGQPPSSHPRDDL